MLSAYDVLTSVILLAILNGYVRSQSCTSSASCISIYDCPSLLMQSKSPLSTSQVNYLRSLACQSGTGRYPYVCCPTSGNNNKEQRLPTGPSTGQGNVLPGIGSCGVQSTGDKVVGGIDTELDEFPWMTLLEYSKPGSQIRSISCGCALINKKYVLTAAHCLTGEIERVVGQLRDFKSPLSTSQVNYLRSLACQSGTGRYPYVCCPTSGDNNKEQRPTTGPSTGPSTGQGNVLPGVGSCGVQSTGDKVVGGIDTELDEFPWMALLEYSKPGSQVRSISCGGALINKKYVLTAAHCLTGEIERVVGQLVNVRLGEYDLTTATDCIIEDCADPVQNIAVDEIIPHPGYDEKNPNRSNDIGLVRLSQDVRYSDFVKPICLSSSVGARRSDATSLLVVAGWGRTYNSSRSDKKQKLTLPYFDHTTCRDKFAKTANAFIDDTQLCAGGNFVQDACRGDSGGPLMAFSNNLWVVEGIVSFGMKICGQQGWPGVYSRVSSFEDWIKSTIRP